MRDVLISGQLMMNVLQLDGRASFINIAVTINSKEGGNIILNIEAIKQMAHELLECQHIENDFIEYKKSDSFSDKILKTACAYANNFMNREIGLLFMGVEEVDDKEHGIKAIPMRPISGIAVEKIENIENRCKKLLANVHPRINYHLISDEIDGRSYIVLAVEPGSNGPYQTSDLAEKTKILD